MFFKNALFYRLTQPLLIDGDALAAAIASKPHREPGAMELSTYGFIAPFDLGEQSPLVQTYASVKYTAQLIAAKKTERILPGTVVRDELAKKVAEIEAEQMRKVYRKEKDQLKDEIIQTLLPRAFLRHKVTYALIIDDLIVVDASSAKHAEDLLSALRESIGSLPVRPISVKVAPTATMTDWLRNAPFGCNSCLSLLDECEMRDTDEEGGIVRCKHQDMESDEVQEHLRAGKLVTKLSLAWSDKLSFVLDDKLSIKRLRFEDLLQEQAEQDGGEDRAGQLVATLAIAAGTLYQFVAELIDALGGEEVPQGV
ncbi:Recombination-associated protein RdgC [compost metagenome]